MAPDIQGGNPILRPLKWYSSLQMQKYRQLENAFVAEGPRITDQILRTCPQNIIEIVDTAECSYPNCSCPIRIISEKQFRSISSVKNPQSPLLVVKLPDNVYTSILPLMLDEKILLLEDIQDPGNVGTLIRTAAALGFGGIILSDKCSDPYLPKTVQASAGTVVSVWTRKNSDYLSMTRQLIEKDYKLFAADTNGTIFKTLGGHKKIILALGNEGNGLSDDLLSISHEAVKIPIKEQNAESLNVAAAGAILMYMASID